MNFGGYEIVRELSRSPIGLEATARGPDGGDEAYFVQVQYLDPIARAGEERVLVDAFLERVRIQQTVGGGHWAKIHAVGEFDRGAFAVSDLSPRNGQIIIDGRARLASIDLQRVILGALDGLIELGEKAGGRAHGALKPEKVLIDDSAGSGRWRVTLRDPAPDAWNAEELAQARLRDARALGAMLIGMVEHRQPRAVPARIEDSEPWKRVGGSQSGAWVGAVNRLLDPDLDPTSNWLAEARGAFAGIEASKQKRSRAPLLIAGVVLLILLGGGGYFAAARLGGQSRHERIVSELTPQVWADWLAACGWVPELGAGLDARWPKGTDDGLSPVARSFLDGIRASLPDTGSRAWAPYDLLDMLRLDDLYIDAGDGTLAVNDALRLRLIESNPNAVKKANEVAIGVRDLRAALSAPAGKGDIEALRAKLIGWGATDSQVAALSDAIGALDPGESSSVDQVVAMVEAVDAGARVKQAGAGLAALEARAASVMSGAGTDPVLSRLPEAVRNGILAAVAAGPDPKGSYETIEAAVAAGNAELDRLAKFLADDYGRVVGPEFQKLIAESGLTIDSGFDAIERWRQLATDPRVVRLPKERDALDALRTAGGVAGLLDPARELLGRLDELAQTSEEQEVRDALRGYRATVGEVETLIGDALTIPATEANEDEIRRLSGEFMGQLREMQSGGSILYRKYSKTLDQVEEILAGMDSAFPDDKELHDAFLASRAELTRLVGEARSLPESEQGRRASELVDQYQQGFDRLEAIRQSTKRPLDLAASAAIDPTPLRTAFEARRGAVQRALIAGAGTPGAEPSAELEALGSEFEAAAAAAADLGARLAQWASAEDIADRGVVLAPVFASGPEATAAFTAAVAPLRERLETLDRLAGRPEELLDIAGDGAAHPELRRAAFERAAAVDGWPASGADLRRVLGAQRAIVDSLAQTGDPLWTEAQVGSIASGLWARAMGNAATEAAFVEVRGMAGDFGLGPDAEGGLSVTVRKNAAMLDLKRAFGGIPETKDEAADEGAVRAAVGDWLSTNRALFSGDADWLLKLDAAMVSQGSGGGDFAPGAYGPGKAGWSGSIDEAFEVISYASGSSALSFRRVGTGDEDPVWFLCTTEVPLSVFLSVAGGSIDAELDGYAGLGPRGWLFDSDAGASDAGGWFESRRLDNDHLAKDPLFDAALRGNETPTSLLTDAQLRGGGMGQRPVQHISQQAVEAFCTALSCELPSVDAWQAAARATFGAGGVAIDAARVGALGVQVRDATWGKQALYYSGLPKNDEKRWEEHKWWYLGGFRWGLTSQAYEAGIGEVWPVDDGRMYFGPVDAGPNMLWSHIVGNVGELVTTQTGLAAIGASAMSPPSIDPMAPIEVRPFRDLPAADIGFRPAFRVPAQALNPTVYRKVQVLLDKTQLTLPGGA